MGLVEFYVTTGQGDRILRINTVTLERWVEAGRLRGERVGSVTLIDRQQVEEVAAERTA